MLESIADGFTSSIENAQYSVLTGCVDMVC